MTARWPSPLAPPVLPAMLTTTIHSARDAEPGKAYADRLTGLPNTSLPTMDHAYLDLLRDVLTHGVERDDRTGTGTLSVFGRMYRHDLADGFPLLTTHCATTR